MVIDLTTDTDLEKKAVIDATVEHGSKLDTISAHKWLTLNNDDFVVEFFLLFLALYDNAALKNIVTFFSRCRSVRDFPRIYRVIPRSYI